MALRDELERRVRAAENAVNELDQRATEAIKDLDLEAIPIETFDDPSVVRHVEDLERTAKRARRESDRLLRKVAGTYIISPSRR